MAQTPSAQLYVPHFNAMAPDDVRLFVETVGTAQLVHVRGRIVVHDDADRVRALVTRLTDHHEQPRAEPWQQ